jgi:ubiquinone/menaquinone biosynthesis C-methylase UbiE
LTKDPSKFWNGMAERYARSQIPDDAAYQKKLEITQSYFRPDMQVLEIGCGTGTTSLIHAPHVAHILATDISENMISIAKDKAAAQNVTNVTFQVSAIDELAVAEESMDVVMAHSILHLVEDRDAVIAKAFSWLKPGGGFVISSICMSDALGFLRPVLPIGRMLGLLPLVRFFSEAELMASLTDAGFNIEHQWRPKKRAATFVIARKKRAEAINIG